MAEQDRMTAALLAAIAHSAEPLVLSDARQPDTPMIAVNSAFEALSGYSRVELIGRNCRLLQGTGTDAATRARIGACVRAGEGCIELDFPQFRSGGRISRAPRRYPHAQ